MGKRRNRKETYEAAIMRAMARNVELEQAYVTLTATLGREPSTRELWAVSPPPETANA